MSARLDRVHRLEWLSRWLADAKPGDPVPEYALEAMRRVVNNAAQDQADRARVPAA